MDRQTDWQAVSIHSFALFSARRDFQPKVATRGSGDCVYVTGHSSQ